MNTMIDDHTAGTGRTVAQRDGPKRGPDDATGASDARWAAVCARDARADGTFFYSVRSTGVFCKPSCASRRPLRTNVAFHETAALAEAAGFRACKRCRPDDTGAASRDTLIVERACRLIEAAETPPARDALAAAVGVSSSQLERLFKAATGLTPRAYAVAHRAGRLRDALAAPDAGDITGSYLDAGFGSSARFYSDAGALLGMAPTRYRDGGARETIRFAVGRGSLGEVLVASTPRGICAILIGDDADALIADLQRRFPRAELIGGDAGFDTVIGTVIGFVDAPALGLALPLDVRGTAFQQRVWQALQRIPPGTTASYAEVASALGSPGAVRAVASACAANAIAVAIPCHRVVRSDGGLSGYRWGVERKRSLLRKEAAPVDDSAGKPERAVKGRR